MSLAPLGLARQAPRSIRPGDTAPQLRVLGRPRRPRRYVLAGLLIAAAGIFGVVSLNALAAEAAFEARALEREVTELGLRYDELTAEVATLSAPSRVRQVAREELGMVPAPAPGFLLVEATPESAQGDGGVATDDPPAARDVARQRPAGDGSALFDDAASDGLPLGGLRAGVHALGSSSGDAVDRQTVAKQASGSAPADPSAVAEGQ